MYFLKMFRLYIATQNALFDGLLDHCRKSAMNWSLTPSNVVFIASWFSLVTYSRFFSLGNRKYTAKDISGENDAFLRAWVLSPTNKVWHNGGGEHIIFEASSPTF